MNDADLGHTNNVQLTNFRVVVDDDNRTTQKKQALKPVLSFTFKVCKYFFNAPRLTLHLSHDFKENIICIFVSKVRERERENKYS